jgi:hypothetical protein
MSNTTRFTKGVITIRTTTCFGYCYSPSSGCYYVYLEVYMCKCYKGWDMLASYRESVGVPGTAVDIVCYI